MQNVLCYFVSSYLDIEKRHPKHGMEAHKTLQKSSELIKHKAMILSLTEGESIRANYFMDNYYIKDNYDHKSYVERLGIQIKFQISQLFKLSVLTL